MRKNISIFVVGLIICFIVIAVKFFHIQIIQSEELQGKVIKQRVRKIEQTPKRGSIKDRSGNTLVYSLNMKDIEIYPDIVKSEKTREEISKTLSENLDIEYSFVMEQLKKVDEDGKPLKWVRIARKVDPIIAAKLQESKVGSLIGITNNPERKYVNQRLASNILGFVNEEGEPGAGLELTLNKYLSGIRGYKIAELDSFGEVIPIGMETISRPIDGSDVHLTIDPFVQTILEETIEEHYEDLDAENMFAITMDPMTGEILGMASYPNFDPNNYQEYDKERYNQHGASYVYEPGSTFKPIYLSVALESGSILPEQTFYDSGTITRNGFSISNWNYQALGDIGLEEIIVRSSNIGMAKISDEVSREHVYKGLSKFGIGAPSGIELPNDESGMMHSIESLERDPLAHLTQSFGHGIATTPMQIVKSYAQIINGGYKIEPTIIKEIRDRGGKEIYKFKKEDKERVISKNTSELISKYLESTWEFHANLVAPEGYFGGGKTGTTTKLKDGRYINETVGSYIGYLLIEENGVKIPKYLTIIVVDEPKDPERKLGLYSAGPIFKDAMDKIVEVKDLEPYEKERENKEPRKFHLGDYELWFLDDALEDINGRKNKDIEVELEGKGKIIKKQSYRFEDNKLKVTLHLTEVRGVEGFYIPDLKGMEPRDIYGLFESQGIDVTFYGNGEVFDQSIEKGFYPSNLKKITLWLSDK